MPISAITVLAAENAGGKGQGGSGAGVCRGDTNGVWGHSCRSLLADPWQVPTGDGPSPCPQGAPREGPNRGARGIPGHGPHVDHAHRHLQNHPCVPLAVLQIHAMGTRVQRHMHVHTWGAKGTGRGRDRTGVAPKGDPDTGGGCGRGCLDRCWTRGTSGGLGATWLRRPGVGGGPGVLGGV